MAVERQLPKGCAGQAPAAVAEHVPKAGAWRVPFLERRRRESKVLAVILPMTKLSSLYCLLPQKRPRIATAPTAAAAAAKMHYGLANIFKIMSVVERNTRAAALIIVNQQHCKPTYAHKKQFRPQRHLLCIQMK